MKVVWKINCQHSNLCLWCIYNKRLSFLLLKICMLRKDMVIKMIDIHSSKEERGIYLQYVGISDVLIQTKLESENTLAKINLGVSLNADCKGIHMSRLCEILSSIENISNETLCYILHRSLDKLDANMSKIIVDTKYFIEKVAPVSKMKAKMDYNVVINAEVVKGELPHFIHIICVPITAVCPCSKAISQYGAHNQRGEVKVSLKDIDVSDYKKVIKIVESFAASQELYRILKRPDEKYVTEHAYEHAKFVEDIVRDAVVGLKNEYQEKLIEVETKNYESIHNHNAYAIYKE